MKEMQDAWVTAMAENLVGEIIEQMANIRLSIVPLKELESKQMVGVYVWVGGDYTMQMSFFAEKNLFYRLAKNMIGDEPTEEDIQDYGMEFLNIVCGRFISEIVNQIHIKVRLMAVENCVLENWVGPDDQKSMRAVGFVSDAQEYAGFSWTSSAIEEMMKRS